MSESQDPLTEKIIGGAMTVHRALGPGLLESAYEECLSLELVKRDIPFRRQVPIRIDYDGTTIDAAYRADLIVANCVLIELKPVEKIIPLHEAQLLTYLKLGQWPVGLLINFNVTLLKNGIRRRVL